MAATLIGESVAGKAMLWRHLSLPKLLHLLQARALYFARVDQLSDPFEGYPTTREIRIASRTLLDPVLRIQSDLIRKCAYVSCWSQYDSENAAMWTTYGATEGDVLVQTRFGRLASILPSSVFLGKVRYVPDSAEELSAPERKPAEVMLRKMDHFVHEREVRAIAFDEDSPIDGAAELGMTMPIDVEELFEAIIVQPTAPNWIRLAVKRLSKQYGFSFNVQRSELSRRPFDG